jgi:uncharacterized protein involved in propanediol utilization
VDRRVAVTSAASVRSILDGFPGLHVLVLEPPTTVRSREVECHDVVGL